MDQKKLYKEIQALGFDIIEFYETPEFFGNWYISIEKDNKTYRIEEDQREGWITMYGKGIQKETPATLSDDQIIAQCKQWLLGV